jgi:hypothetical protein
MTPNQMLLTGPLVNDLDQVNFQGEQPMVVSQMRYFVICCGR